jgi:hypothetical protein
MPSSPHHEMIRAQQCEIAARTVHAHHRPELPHTSAGSRRNVGRRVRGVVAATALGLGFASTGVVLAHPGDRPARASGAYLRHATGVSAYQRRIHALEAEGYVGEACTVKGILMYNPRTHRTVTVAL